MNSQPTIHFSLYEEALSAKLTGRTLTGSISFSSHGKNLHAHECTDTGLCPHFEVHNSVDLNKNSKGETKFLILKTGCIR